MELFRQRKVNIKITITWEEKNSRDNEMSLNIDILSDRALKFLYDEFYLKIYMMNETLKEKVDDEEKPQNTCEVKNDEMSVEDIPF